MITLRNKHDFPPGGWQYIFVPEGDPEAALVINMGLDLRQTVSTIVKYRKANPALGLSIHNSDAEQSLFEYTFGRLRDKYGEKTADRWFQTAESRSAIVADYSKKKPLYRLLEEKGNARPAVVEAYHRGAKTLASWVGEGAHPVAADIANHRAGVCVACPLNQPDDNWLSRLAVAVSSTVRAALQLKTQMNLRTDQDNDLFVCTACRCPLPLKVWVPMETILAEMDNETFESLHPKCWIKQ